MVDIKRYLTREQAKVLYDTLLWHDAKSISEVQNKIKDRKEIKFLDEALDHLRFSLVQSFNLIK